MTSFSAIDGYSPVMVLVIGACTLIGYWGTGTALLHVVRCKIPSPWHWITAILLGIQATSLVIEIVGMADCAYRSVLDAIWLAELLIGIAGLRLFARWSGSHQKVLRITRFELLPIAIIGVAVVSNLLISIAPSTKIDELYYHMLVPSRIVSDGALRFYRMPWEAAIWPQMIYQVAATPAHAIGYPDSANVVSWALSATMLWFAWRLMHDSEKPTIWSTTWSASLCVGLYSSVWQVTAGSQAMGDLAIAAAVVALCSRDRLLASLQPTAYAAMLSIFALSAATSKISLLPLAVILLAVGALPLLHFSRPKSLTVLITATAAPWLIFYLPIVIWTWIESGSPFGPILSGSVSHSLYPTGWADETFQHTRQVNQTGLLKVIGYVAVNYSPLVWLGTIGAIFWTTLPSSLRICLTGLFVMQIALIYFLLPYDARFLGGLQYGLVIVFACFVRPDLQQKLSSVRAAAIACVLFLVPWLSVQIYYASQFFPVSLGLEKTAFYQRYVPFYDDYLKLDRILPSNAVILARDFRLSAVYAPRPIYFDASDLPDGKEVVLFAPSQAVDDRVSIGRYRIGDEIYEDPNAVVETFRSPGRRPMLGSLKVVRLIPD
jgi:hypothetical protein